MAKAAQALAGSGPSLATGLRGLIETVATLSNERDLARVTHEAPRLARRLLKTDLSTLLTPDSDGERLDVVGWDGMVNADAIRELATPIGKNLAGLVAAERRALRSDDVARDERSSLPAVGRCKIASAMLVPVDLEGEAAAVLAVETRSPRSFSDEDEALLQLVANQVAAAFKRSHPERSRSTPAADQAVVHGAPFKRSRSEPSRSTDGDGARAALTLALHENALMRRTQDARDRLTRAALDGAGLAGLVELLAGLIGSPLALTDRFGAVIAAEGFPVDAEPPRRIDPGDGRQAVPLVAADGTLGHLVACAGTELGEAEAQILVQAAAVVAGEALRERSAAEAEVRLHGGLLESLLAGGASADRAALLGVDLSGPKCVVAITPAHAAFDARAAISSGRHACSSHGLRGVFGPVDGTVATLLVSADRDVCRSTVEAWLTTFLAALEQRELPAPAAVGISSIFDEPDQVRAAVDDARRAARVGDIRANGNVTFFDDVELLAVFAGVASRAQLERYVRHRIGALLDYDGGTNTDLARTLEVYLDHACVARHAAAALYLHPHSLRYRLRRIKEVQQIELDDPFERLSAHLALKLRQLLPA